MLYNDFEDIFFEARSETTLAKSAYHKQLNTISWQIGAHSRAEIQRKDKLQKKESGYIMIYGRKYWLG